MSENMSALEPEALMKSWMSYGGQMQDQFMTLMRQASAGTTSGASKK